MDNKKLMQILLRDVSELQELISNIRNTGQIDAYEAELLHTRISGVRHMLEVISAPGAMHQKEEPETVRAAEMAVSAPQKDTLTVKSAGEPPKEEIPAPVANRHDPYPAPPETPVKPAPEVKPDIQEPTVKLPAAETIPAGRDQVTAAEFVPPREEKLIAPAEKAVHPEVKAGKKDEMEFEEEDLAAGKQTLGEKFTHGKSVNDLLLEQGRPDTKFSNMPVTSLQAAIGINDKFLFTRELFEGNAEVFSETIRKIDSMTNLHDAATFLRDNFKWKKNDTSLKFIDLIKRRFL